MPKKANSSICYNFVQRGEQIMAKPFSYLCDKYVATTRIQLAQRLEQRQAASLVLLTLNATVYTDQGQLLPLFLVFLH